MRKWTDFVSPDKPEIVSHFDWLTAVIPADSNTIDQTPYSVEDYVKSKLDELGFSSLLFEPLKHGIYFYDSAMSAGSGTIIVGYYSTPGVTQYNNFMIQISGQGLDTMRSLYSNQEHDIEWFIRKVVNLDGHFSRVDACFNFFNYDKHFSSAYVDKMIDEGKTIKRARFHNANHSTRLDKMPTGDPYYLSSDVGYTTYIGENPKQLRIYNKLAERTKVHLLYPFKSWSRWEFQLNNKKDNKAQQFIDDYLKYGFDATFIGWVKDFIRFIRLKKGVRPKLCPMAKWWREFVNGHPKIHHPLVSNQPTFERTTKWLEKQVSGSVTNIYMAKLQKYRENGLADYDAQILAQENIVKLLIDNKVFNHDFDEQVVSSYLVEHYKEL